MTEYKRFWLKKVNKNMASKSKHNEISRQCFMCTHPTFEIRSSEDITELIITRKPCVQSQKNNHFDLLVQISNKCTLVNRRSTLNRNLV
jgi:hypothetical protein